MANFSGVWKLKEHIQARASGTWTNIPLPALYGFGRSNVGQGGWGTAPTNDNLSKSSPIQLGTDTNWKQVSAGYGKVFSAAIRTDGTIWTWGQGSQGKLGTEDNNNTSSPTQVGSLTDWYQVSAGDYHCSAVKTDGTLWTWGDNLYGQLGIANVQPVDKSSPVQVGALTNWSVVSAGNDHCAAIKTDGTLWTWGDNGSGKLGQNSSTTLDRSSPVLVGADTDWYEIAATGLNHMMATKTDGTLWAWGDNGSGQLGQSNATTIDASSPVQIGALTTWADISVGGAFSGAIKTDGTLWTWGSGSTGRTGHNSTTGKSSPVQVGSLTNWSQIECGGNSCLSIKTDGTLWAWGGNGFGELGQENTVYISSPVQVGSLTTWASASTSGFTSFAILNTYAH